MWSIRCLLVSLPLGGLIRRSFRHSVGQLTPVSGCGFTSGYYLSHICFDQVNLPVLKGTEAMKLKKVYDFAGDLQLFLGISSKL